MDSIIILALSILLVILVFIYRYASDRQIKQRTEELERSKNQIEAIINSSHDALLATDVNNKIILVNSRFEKIFQIEAAKVISQDLGRFIGSFKKKIAEPEKFIDLANSHLRENFAIHQEEIELTNSTKHTFLKIYDSPILNKKDESIGRLIVFYDFTKDKEIDKVKTEFVSIASHQLRTPLSAMRWFLEMLSAGDAGELNSQQKDFVDQVYRSILRMTELVNSLLNISRLETGRLTIKPELFGPIDLVQGIIDENRQIAKSRNCKILFEKQNSVDKINHDPSLIRQVFDNLVSNAIKYSKWGEKFKIVIKLEQNEKETVFSVSDFGIGIPQKDQFRVFQKFFRSDNVATRDAEGAGLGLYICKMIIESAGGRMWFKSKENEGTTFYFTLPNSGPPRVRPGGVELSEVRSI